MDFDTFKDECVAKLESMKNDLSDDIEKIKNCNSDQEIIFVITKSRFWGDWNKAPAKEK